MGHIFTLNISSITNKHFIQGYLKGHVIRENTTVIKSNKVILAPMDKQFFNIYGALLSIFTKVGKTHIVVSVQ